MHLVHAIQENDFFNSVVHSLYGLIYGVALTTDQFTVFMSFSECMSLDPSCMNCITVTSDTFILARCLYFTSVTGFCTM